MREYDVAAFDADSGCFQEYQKASSEMRYQLQNGQRFVRPECFGEEK